MGAQARQSIGLDQARIPASDRGEEGAHQCAVCPTVAVGRAPSAALPVQGRCRPRDGHRHRTAHHRGLPGRSAYPAASTFFDNDAKLATLAEAEWGNLAGAGNALFILVGRRDAAGLVVDGRLVRGSRGAAGEPGALTRVGWISATDRFLSAGPNSAGPNSAGAGNTEAIISSALRGDPDAERALADFAENIAEGVAALVLTIDPEVVVVGGGFSRAGELLLTPLRAAIAPLTIYSPEVMLSSLGSNAIALGAVARSLAHVRVAAMDLPS